MALLRNAVLYQYLPDEFRLITQPEDTTKKALLTSIIEAISEQDLKNFDLLTEARKQLFLSSASGKYLIDLAAQNGFNLPQRSGLDQTGISKLAAPVVNKPKQLLSTINYLTEVVYAPSTLHPSFFTTQAEPYSLADGDNLTLKTEVSTVNIILKSSAFANIARVSASELAGFINGTQQTTVFADTFFDRTVNSRRLRISGKSFGLSARLQCIGGTAQNILRFPNLTETSNTVGTTWLITKPATYNNITTFTWDGSGVNPQTYNINIGDFCTIRGLADNISNFSKLNGTYQVVDCGFNYFTIKTTNFNSVNTSYTQTKSTEILFTSSYARTLYDNDQYALNYEPAVGQLNMIIPPIPSIVKRELKGATHLHGSVYPISYFDQNTITIPYSSTLPDNGTFVLRSDKFNNSFDDRYFNYSSIQATSGGSQSISLNLNGYNGFPYFSETAAAPMKSLTDTFYATLDSNHYEIYTPGINLHMENNLEFSLSGFQFNRAPTPSSNNIYTVNSILLPYGSTSVDFVHSRNSRFIYMQFRDSSTGELLPMSYKASAANPLNATTIQYGPQAAGRVVSATMVVCQTTSPVPVNEATLVLTRSINGGTGSITINHGMNSSNIMFMVMESNSGATINAERLILDPNNVRFDYVNLPSGSYSFLFINMSAPVVPGTDTNPLRYTNSGLTLRANQTSLLVNHSLRASNIMVEIRKTGGLPYLVNGTEIEFIRATFVDQDNLRIDYLNLASDMTFDLFMVYDTKNTSTVSVDGGLSLSDINSPHIVRHVRSKDRIVFEINNPDGTPKAYQGAIVGGFNVVAAVDPNGDYDAYLQFNTSLSRQDARITNGTKIKLMSTGTVPSQISTATAMRSRYLAVVSQSNNNIYIKTGVQATPGPIIVGEQCRCSTYFGGSGAFLSVNPTSAWNASNVYSNLNMVLVSRPVGSYPGSYVYDTRGIKNPFVIGGSTGISILQTTIQLSSSPGVLLVDSVAGFNTAGGYLSVEYGSSSSEGPIRYYGVTTGINPSIIIDKAYVFKNKHMTGASVFNVRSIYPYSTQKSSADYPAYITGSSNARNAFVNIIQDTVASGIILNVQIQAPGLRNQEPGIPIF
jgi:hypothetical protein